VKRADVPVVLARHGVDPDLDAEGLIAALTARGWRATVEEVGAGPRSGPRVSVLATRPKPAGAASGYRSFPDHAQALGRTEAEALARVLAAVLAQEVGP